MSIIKSAKGTLSITGNRIKVVDSFPNGKKWATIVHLYRLNEDKTSIYIDHDALKILSEKFAKARQSKTTKFNI